MPDFRNVTIGAKPVKLSISKPKIQHWKTKANWHAISVIQTILDKIKLHNVTASKKLTAHLFMVI